MSLSVTGQGQATNEECLAALREYMTQKRVCDSEGGVLRSIVKRWKSAGVPIPAMLATAKASKRDPEEVVAEIRETLRMMNLRKIPVTRYNLFPEAADLHVADKAQAEDDMWSVEDHGYRAGMSGVVLDDNPHPFGTEKHVAWTKFWHEGQATHARVLGDNARRIAAGRDRPANRGGPVAETDSAEQVETDLGAKAVTRKRAAGPKRAGGSRAAGNGAQPRRRRPGGDHPAAA